MKQTNEASHTPSESSDEQAAVRKGTGFWAVMQSVGAAMIGVQSRKNRERDFTQGKPIQFIIVGLVGTALFLLVVNSAVLVSDQLIHPGIALNVEVQTRPEH